MKKTLLSLVAVVVVASIMVACLVGCNNTRTEKQEIELPAYEGIVAQTVSKAVPSDFKIGLICLHDENSTYDKNFISAMKEVQKELNMSDEQVIIATGIPESVACYEKAKDLVQNYKCNVVIADSFGHEKHMIRAAKEFSNVLFAHATGTRAHTEKLPNYVNAFASIYEGRYLAGVVAGLKLKEMIDSGKVAADKAKVGYIGAYTYAEVISGYTSWFLGVRSIVPTVTMDVTFTGSWYDETAEKNSAISLINSGCVLISQHADSWGAPTACEEAGVPNVSYNGSTFSACQDTFLVSSRINWAPYYKYLIDAKLNNKTTADIGYDYTGTLKTGSVELTNLGAAVAEGTKEKVIEVRTKLANGTLQVFDTATFKVNGETLSSFVADVDDLIGENGKSTYEPDTEVIEAGILKESKFRSAPYFNLEIDGITLLNREYGED